MSTQSDWFIIGYTVDQCCLESWRSFRITSILWNMQNIFKRDPGSKEKIIFFARLVQGLFFGQFTGTM